MMWPPLPPTDGGVMVMPVLSPELRELDPLKVAPPVKAMARNTHHAQVAVPLAVLTVAAVPNVDDDKLMGEEDVPVKAYAFVTVVVVDCGIDTEIPAPSCHVAKVFAPDTMTPLPVEFMLKATVL